LRFDGALKMSDKLKNLGISTEAYDRLLIEENWQSMRPERNADRFNHLLRLGFAEQANTEDAIEVFMHFVSLVSEGVTPPAIVLAAVAKGFRTYLTDGNMSIDECFNLKPKQGVGHPIKYRAEQAKKRQLTYKMWLIRKESIKKGKKISIENAAAKVIDEYSLKLQTDALKKQYTNQNADEVFERSAESLMEAIEYLQGKENKGLIEIVESIPQNGDDIEKAAENLIEEL
jgi:hypothetical protein